MQRGLLHNSRRWQPGDALSPTCCFLFGLHAPTEQLTYKNTFLPWQCFYGLTAPCGKFHRRAKIYKKRRFKRVWSRHLRHICYPGLQSRWDHIRLGNEIEWSRTPDSTLLIHGQIKSDTDRGAGCCTVNHGHSKKTHMVDSVLHNNVLTNQSLNLNFVQWRL